MNKEMDNLLTFIIYIFLLVFFSFLFFNFYLFLWFQSTYSFLMLEMREGGNIFQRKRKVHI